jgi:hypothetical protein
VRSVLENKAPGVEAPRWPQHPLPRRNSSSRGENHLTEANGRSVYEVPVAAGMFRLYAGAAQAAARLETDIIGAAAHELHGHRQPDW